MVACAPWPLIQSCICHRCMLTMPFEFDKLWRVWSKGDFEHVQRTSTDRSRQEKSNERCLFDSFTSHCACSIKEKWPLFSVVCSQHDKNCTGLFLVWTLWNMSVRQGHLLWWRHPNRTSSGSCSTALRKWTSEFSRLARWSFRNDCDYLINHMLKQCHLTDHNCLSARKCLNHHTHQLII